MNGNKPKKGKISEKKLYFVYHFLVTKSVVCNKILFKVFIHGELISGVGLSLWFMVHQLNVILMGYNPAVLLLDGVEKHRIIVNVAVALITDFKYMKRVRFQKKTIFCLLFSFLHTMRRDLLNNVLHLWAGIFLLNI